MNIAYDYNGNQQHYWRILILTSGDLAVLIYIAKSFQGRLWKFQNRMCIEQQFQPKMLLVGATVLQCSRRFGEPIAWHLLFSDEFENLVRFEAFEQINVEIVLNLIEHWNSSVSNGYYWSVLETLRRSKHPAVSQSLLLIVALKGLFVTLLLSLWEGGQFGSLFSNTATDTIFARSAPFLEGAMKTQVLLLPLPSRI